MCVLLLLLPIASPREEELNVMRDLLGFIAMKYGFCVMKLTRTLNLKHRHPFLVNGSYALELKTTFRSSLLLIAESGIRDIQTGR